MKRITRKYDNEAAIVGAPVGCRDERYIPDILKRTEDAIFGTVSADGREEQIIRWNKNGMTHVSIPGPHDLVMEPLGFCEDRPVWSGDILFDKQARSVEFVGWLGGLDFSDYTWSAPAKWPTSTADPEQLHAVWGACPSNGGGLQAVFRSHIAVANAAIAHECEAGNLIPRATVEKMVRRALDISRGVALMDKSQVHALVKTIVASN